MQDYLQELGFAKVMSSGRVIGFEWQEVHSFITLSGYDINHEQAKCLVDMSRAYASGYCDTNPLSIPPMERNNYD